LLKFDKLSQIVKKKMSVNTSERKKLILDAAASLILRHGYNKTTMEDIAQEVGLSRGLIYINFDSKEALLEALIAREMARYGNLWIEHIESDPQGGSIGSVYRGILNALRQTPLLAAIVTRSEGAFGKYLRKPNNIFSTAQTPDLMRNLLKAMQDGGAIRKDVDVEAMAYIMDVLSAGIVDNSVAPDSPLPAYELLLETIADMLDRMLTPEGGGDLTTGKAIIRQFAAAAPQYLPQNSASESE
jgi:AcrR family transcriptional regulator